MGCLLIYRCQLLVKFSFVETSIISRHCCQLNPAIKIDFVSLMISLHGVLIICVDECIYLGHVTSSDLDEARDIDRCRLDL